MKIQIPERIELQDIVKLSQWENCYLLVNSCSVQELKEFSSTQAKINRRIEELQKQKNKYSNLALDANDAQTRELIQDIERKIDKANDELFDFLVEFIANRTIRGLVYDAEAQKTVEISKDNAIEALRQFNIKMIKKIIQIMLGAETDLK